MAGGEKYLQSIGLDTQQRAPPPPGRAEGAQLSTSELGADVMGHQRIPTIAGGAAKRVGGRDVADREDASMARHSQVGCHANEPMLVKQFLRQPVRIGLNPTYGPQHRIGESRGLSGTPADRLAGQISSPAKPFEYHRAVSGVEADAEIGESAADALPNSRVVRARKRALRGSTGQSACPATWLPCWRRC